MFAMPKFLYLGSVVTVALGGVADTANVCASQSCDAQTNDGDYQSLLVTPKRVWKARESKVANMSLNVTGSRFDKVPNMTGVVLNVTRRSNRWETISRNLAQAAPWMNFDRVDVGNMKVNPPSEEDVSSFWNTTEGVDSPSSHAPMVLKMNRRQLRSCSAHIAAWRMASKNDSALVVIEDDVTILENFTVSLHQALEETPNGTAVIFLTGFDGRNPEVSGKMVANPVGYVIFPAGARTLLEHLPINMPVEEWLSTRARQGDIKVWNMRGPILDGSRKRFVSVTSSDSDDNDDSTDDDYYGSDDNDESNPEESTNETLVPEAEE